VADGGLQCGVGEEEGVLVALLRFGLGGAPDGVGPAHQVTAVEVVAGVHRLPGLLAGRHARIEPPVDARAGEVAQQGAVDAHGGHRGQPPVGPAAR